jgi:OmpA-OmpF porin, OOP family
MRFTRLIPIVVAVLALAAPIAAQDTEGSKDHPMFSRMPGYLIFNYDPQDFGAEDFTLDANGTQMRVEGKYTQISYGIPEGGKKAGPLQIGRNYTDLIVKRGGKKLFEELSAGGGTTVATLPAGAGRALWLMVQVNNNGDQYILTIVEEGAMKQEVEFTAGDLAEALKTKGSIALHGILFETGSATIKPESANALAVIADVMKSDPALKLEIQGHTDNVGAPAANLKLSQERAASVRAYLVASAGVAPARLTTAGLGDTKPIGDNKTEEGRAQNRRVELVKK